MIGEPTTTEIPLRLLAEADYQLRQAGEHLRRATLLQRIPCTLSLVRLAPDELREAWSELTAEGFPPERSYPGVLEQLRASGSTLLTEALSAAAWIYERRGFYEPALALLEELLERARATGDRERELVALRRIGTIEVWKTEYTNALEHYNAILDMVGDEDHHAKVMALGGIGIIKVHSGQYEESIPYFEQQAKLFEARGEMGSMAASIGNVGLALWYQSRFDEAMEKYREQYAIFESIGNRRGMALTLPNLGSIDLARGDYARARARYEEFHQVATSLGDLRSQMIALVNLATIAGDLGEFEKSLEVSLRQLELAKVLDEKHGIITALGNIALARHELGDAEAAVSLLEEAIERLKVAPSPFFASFMHGALGRSLFRLGRLEDARSALETSERIATEVSQRESMFRSRILLARLEEQNARGSGLSRLTVMLNDFQTDVEQAELFYWIWRFTGEEQHRTESLRRYLALSNQQRYDTIRNIRRLRGERTPESDDEI